MSYSIPSTPSIQPTVLTWQYLGLQKGGELWLSSDRSKYKILRYLLALRNDGYDISVPLNNLYLQWRKDGGINM